MNGKGPIYPRTIFDKTTLKRTEPNIRVVGGTQRAGQWNTEEDSTHNILSCTGIKSPHHFVREILKKWPYSNTNEKHGVDEEERGCLFSSFLNNTVLVRMF